MAHASVIDQAFRATPVAAKRVRAASIIADAAAPRFRVVMMHPMDPRGSKLGGIETHVRLVLAHHPADVSILFVGVDEMGDGALGTVRTVVVNGRPIDFLPVAAIPARDINVPGRKIRQSTTFRFAMGLLRHLGALRAAARGTTSAELQRFEFAAIPRLLGLPTVQMVHGEGAKNQEMDSLIKKYWFLHRANETLALTLARRVVAVNPAIVERLATILPKAARKADVMSVSVDTHRFRATPFDTQDGVFRVVFAGRLDAFKDPGLMFRTLAAVAARLAGRFEFHYVGSSDPQRYADFAAVEPFTIRHGLMSADGVAGVLARCHAGILTSHFEGMPCFLLETLATGRPFAAIRLPQYDPLIVAGHSGAMVERHDGCEIALADSCVAIWDGIQAGVYDPAAIHRLIEPSSVDQQLGRLFAHHRAVARPSRRRSPKDGVPSGSPQR